MSFRAICCGFFLLVVKRAASGAHWGWFLGHFLGYLSDCGGMQISLPPLGLWDVGFEAKDRKREGLVPSYIGARLLTSVIAPPCGGWVFCSLHKSHEPHFVRWVGSPSSGKRSNYSDLTRVFTPNGGLVREISLFQGNLGWWNIIIWLDVSKKSPTVGSTGHGPFHRQLTRNLLT